MFELLRPNKESVGKRIRMVKEELGVSLTELGHRLGVIKPTMNSYVQGYTLAPLEVIQKLANITGKSIGWFYFGNMEEYIQDYLVKKGHGQLLEDYPNISAQLKDEFLNNKSKSWEWKNDFGYPCEAALDEAFAEIYHDIMKEYFLALTKEFIASCSSMDGKQQEEATDLIAAELYECFVELGDCKYGDTEKIQKSIKFFYERDVKGGNISFNDEYLVGKLINILGDDEQTINLISSLSRELTGKAGFYSKSGDRELIEAFQAIRPALIKLYTKNSRETFYDWFEE